MPAWQIHVSCITSEGVSLLFSSNIITLRYHKSNALSRMVWNNTRFIDLFYFVMNHAMTIKPEHNGPFFEAGTFYTAPSMEVSKCIQNNRSYRFCGYIFIAKLFLEFETVFTLESEHGNWIKKGPGLVVGHLEDPIIIMCNGEDAKLVLLGADLQMTNFTLSSSFQAQSPRHFRMKVLSVYWDLHRNVNKREPLNSVEPFPLDAILNSALETLALHMPRVLQYCSNNSTYGRT